MHRFSPYSTRAIKGRKNGVRIRKKKIDKSLSENNLVDHLMDMGYSFEEAWGCIPYLEKKNIKHAVDFIENFKCNYE
tara:strand:+ start:1038 stop:1268 length:231 start_codon:yes stop_codon:yes gene_type:complete